MRKNGWKIWVGIVVGAVIVGAGWLAWWYLTPPREVEVEKVVEKVVEKEVPRVSSFDECVEAGYPVQESYPRRCVTSYGDSFTEDVGNAVELEDEIVLDAPRPNAEVGSPLELSGQARGTWFFEATMPVRIESESGEVLANTYVSTTDDWMTEDFVSFEGEVEFSVPASGEKIYLVIAKANPSGLPGNELELMIPLTVK